MFQTLGEANFIPEMVACLVGTRGFEHELLGLPQLVAQWQKWLTLQQLAPRVTPKLCWWCCRVRRADCEVHSLLNRPLGFGRKVCEVHLIQYGGGPFTDDLLLAFELIRLKMGMWKCCLKSNQVMCTSRHRCVS